MTARTFVRDALGRFARTAGKKVAAEAKKIAAEEAADMKRLAKAKLDAQVAGARAELEKAQAEARAQEATRDAVHTDMDAVEFERARKKARDRVRRAKLKLAGLRAAAAGVE